MTLNSSGQISLGGSTSGQSIALELGQGATSQISLNDSAVRALAGVVSGAISIPSDFWGKSSGRYYFAFFSVSSSVSSVGPISVINQSSGSVWAAIYRFSCTGNQEYLVKTDVSGNVTSQYLSCIVPATSGYQEVNDVDSSYEIYQAAITAGGYAFNGYGINIPRIKFNKTCVQTSYSRVITSIPCSFFASCVLSSCTPLQGSFPFSVSVDSSNNPWFAYTSTKSWPVYNCYYGGYAYLLSHNLYPGYLVKTNSSLGVVSVYRIPAVATTGAYEDALAVAGSTVQILLAYKNLASSIAYLFETYPYWYSTGNSNSSYALDVVNTSTLAVTRHYMYTNDKSSTGGLRPPIWGGSDYNRTPHRDSSGNTYVICSKKYTDDFYLIKVTTSNTYVQKKLTVTGATQSSTAKVLVDSSDNVYVIAIYRTDSNYYYKIVVFKFNSSLTLQWARYVQGNNTTSYYGAYFKRAVISTSSSKPSLQITSSLTQSGQSQATFIMSMPLDGSLTQTFTLNSRYIDYGTESGAAATTSTDIGIDTITGISVTSISVSDATGGSTYTSTSTSNVSTSVQVL